MLPGNGAISKTILPAAPLSLALECLAHAALGQRMCMAARGHSCPQPLPNANIARICCLLPQNTLLRTGMSARRAARIRASLAQGGSRCGHGGGMEGARCCFHVDHTT